MKIIIASGGSGGHVFPAVSVARELKNSDNKIFFITTKKYRDKEILANISEKVYDIAAAPMPEKMGLGIIAFFFKFLIGFFQSLFLILKIGPKVVVGFGGYVCAPVIIAAKTLGRPTLIHEQNVYPGKANKLVSRFTDKIALSFKETSQYMGGKNYFVSGNPIREDFNKITRQEARKRLGIEEGEFNILIMGGSQGSHKINMIVPEVIKELKGKYKNICVTHITGKDDEQAVKQEYAQINVPHLVYPYLANIWYPIRACDLVIARSGASSLTEYAACGIAAILIPYPFAGAHQKYNADILKKDGACEVIDDSGLTKEALEEKIEYLLEDKDKLAHLSKNIQGFYKADSSRLIASEITSLAGK